MMEYPAEQFMQVAVPFDEHESQLLIEQGEHCPLLLRIYPLTQAMHVLDVLHVAQFEIPQG